MNLNNSEEAISRTYFDLVSWYHHDSSNMNQYELVKLLSLENATLEGDIFMLSGYF